MDNRGQLGNLQGIIFTLIIVGVILGAGFFIFGELLNGGVLNGELQTVTNNTAGFLNTSGFTLPGGPGANGFAVSAVRNGTSGVTINSGRYAVNSVTGVITNATVINFASIHVDYTFLGGEEAYTALNDTITALNTVPNLLPLVVLITMVVIILSLVFTIPGTKGA